MKNIIFLENDYKCPSSDDSIDAGKTNLDLYFGVPDESIEAMKVYYSFAQEEREKQMEVCFGNDDIIATYSVYCSGSDYAFMAIVAAAASNEIKNKVYLDTSGLLVKFLNRSLRDQKQFLRIAAGINSNFIYTNIYDSDPHIMRVKIEINGYYDDYVKLEPADLSVLN